mgnify:CR=1 FL=1
MKHILCEHCLEKSPVSTQICPNCHYVILPPSGDVIERRYDTFIAFFRENYYMLDGGEFEIQKNIKKRRIIIR